MKKTLILLSFIILISCETKQDIQSDIDQLRSSKATLQLEVQNLEYFSSTKQEYIKHLDQDIKEKVIIADGRIPKYVLRLHLKQSHVSHSITEHIKDNINAIDFDLPVDKEFFDSVKEGDNIVHGFRSGSFIMNGSFGNWEMTVKDKSIL